jgi:hypothetical protein
VFLFAVVLVLAMAASVVSQVKWPVLGPVLAIGLLVLAVAAAAALIVPLLVTAGRDSENTRKTLQGIDLVPLDDEPGRTVRVLETERRQTSIGAARAKSPADELMAVLTPDASRWLGRQLRVAVDLIAGDGSIHRAGFVPPELDADLDARLQPLVRVRRAATVPATIVDAGADSPRRLRVEIRL